VGYDASGDNLRRAQGVKAIDRRGSLRDALADADLVIVATPVGSMKALFEEIAPVLPVDALVMDTGSTKAQVLRWAADLLPTACASSAATRWLAKPKRGPMRRTPSCSMARSGASRRCRALGAMRSTKL
jgi:predicted dinucleotide-binding enzyme